MRVPRPIGSLVLVTAVGVVSYGALLSQHNVDAQIQHVAAVSKMRQTHILAKSSHVRLSPELLDHFAIFRQALSGPRLPAGAAASVAGDSSSFVNASRARYVRVGAGAWVVPGSNAVCVLDRDYNATCGSLRSAADGSLILGNQTADSQGLPGQIIGLAPDGNRRVIVGFADGATAAVTVRDNMYVAGGPGIESVTLTTAFGSRRTVHFRS